LLAKKSSLRALFHIVTPAMIDNRILRDIERSRKVVEKRETSSGGTRGEKKIEHDDYSQLVLDPKRSERISGSRKDPTLERVLRRDLPKSMRSLSG